MIILLITIMARHGTNLCRPGSWSSLRFPGCGRREQSGSRKFITKIFNSSNNNHNSNNTNNNNSTNTKTKTNLILLMIMTIVILLLLIIIIISSSSSSSIIITSIIIIMCIYIYIYIYIVLFRRLVEVYTAARGDRGFEAAQLLALAGLKTTIIMFTTITTITIIITQDR